MFLPYMLKIKKLVKKNKDFLPLFFILLIVVLVRIWGINFGLAFF